MKKTDVKKATNTAKHKHSHACPKCGYRSTTHLKCPTCHTKMEEICKKCGHAKSVCAYEDCNCQKISKKTAKK